MVKIANLILPPELEEDYFKTMKPADRFTYSRVVKKPLIVSRKRLQGLSQKTLLPQVSQLWNDLSQNDKEAWNEAAEASFMKGYRLFVQDTCYRLSHGIAGMATPDNMHQCYVGKITIEEPATQIALVQIHPSCYYVLKKVTGTKAQYEPKQITEYFSVPITIKLNYKADLTAVTENPICAIFAEIYSSYQGIDRIDACQIDLDLTTDWKSASETLTTTQGYFISYSVKIYLENVQGELLFDDVQIVHNSQNWARDPKCNKIETTFTKAFYQIPKHWAPISLPDGADYGSVYPEE